MLFNSAEYLLLFLPLVFLVFLKLARPGSTEAQITWLIAASMVFYASWKPVYLLLILFSVAINFMLGKRLAKAELGGRPALLTLGVGINLGILGLFKYTGFAVESLNALGQWLIPVPEITLPLAISFFTFQQIAYLVDVARGECREYEFRHYALFVLFFPQLIAGPIVHHSEMMPQFERPRRPDKLPTDLAVGTTFIIIGLFKKVVMADSLALLSDPVFDSVATGAPVNSIDTWVAGLAFSFQIYFDFSGYSDIAIGSARLFGIRLPENFNSPYKATSIIDIWRRWHITLSRFLRDYLYIALGGNRRGKVSRYLNLMITMLLGGLWHGAAWTFVIWGGLHGFYLWINHAWHALLRRTGSAAFFQQPLFKPLFILMTFLAWSLALVVFRSADFSTAWSMVQHIGLDWRFDAPLLLGQVFTQELSGRVLALSGLQGGPYTLVWALLALSAAICWMLPNAQQFLRDYEPVLFEDERRPAPGFISWRPHFATALVLSAMLGLSLLSLNAVTEFIYFQF